MECFHSFPENHESHEYRILLLYLAYEIFNLSEVVTFIFMWGGPVTFLS